TSEPRARALEARQHAAGDRADERRDRHGVDHDPERALAVTDALDAVWPGLDHHLIEVGDEEEARPLRMVPLDEEDRGLLARGRAAGPHQRLDGAPVVETQLGQHEPDDSREHVERAGRVVVAHDRAREFGGAILIQPATTSRSTAETVTPRASATRR